MYFSLFFMFSSSIILYWLMDFYELVKTYRIHILFIVYNIIWMEIHFCGLFWMVFKEKKMMFGSMVDDDFDPHLTASLSVSMSLFVVLTRHNSQKNKQKRLIIDCLASIDFGLTWINKLSTLFLYFQINKFESFVRSFLLLLMFYVASTNSIINTHHFLFSFAFDDTTESSMGLTLYAILKNDEPIISLCSTFENRNNILKLMRVFFFLFGAKNKKSHRQGKKDFLTIKWKEKNSSQKRYRMLKKKNGATTNVNHWMPSSMLRVK